MTNAPTMTNPKMTKVAVYYIILAAHDCERMIWGGECQLQI